MGATRVPVMCTPAMAEFLRTNSPWQGLIDWNHIVLETLTPGKDFALSPNLTGRAFVVPHRGEYTDTVGYLISGPRKGLLYIPDLDGWEGFVPTFNELAVKADYIFIDGTFATASELTEMTGRIYQTVPHPPIRETMRRLADREIQVDSAQVLFTHFNHSNPIIRPGHPLAETLEAKGLTLAHDGDTFPL